MVQYSKNAREIKRDIYSNNEDAKLQDLNIKNLESEEEEEIEDPTFLERVFGWFKGVIGSFRSGSDEDSEDENEDEEEVPQITKATAKQNLSQNQDISYLERFASNDLRKSPRIYSSQNITVVPSSEMNFEVVFHVSKNSSEDGNVVDAIASKKTCVIRFDEQNRGEFDKAFNFVLGASRAVKGSYKEIEDGVYIFSPNASVVVSDKQSLNLKLLKEKEFHLKIFRLTDHRDRQKVMQYLKAGIPCMVLFEELEDQVVEGNILTRSHTFEFIKGVAITLDAHIKKVQNYIYLISPKEVPISTELKRN